MNDDAPNIGWESIFWETRRYLDVDDDAPVPVSELKETALANGWTEGEFKAARRATGRLNAVGENVSDPRVVLDDGEDSEGDDSPETPTESTTTEADSESADGQAALADAVRWFHARIDDEIADHTDSGGHPDRPTTAREWFEDARGFDTETVDEKALGWVPADASDRLVRYLHDQGHDREAILATGLFTEDLRLLWHGRYVFPYFDRDGQPAYAIARATGDKGGGDAGYDGHPEDFLPGKYAKLAHSKEYVTVEEPIYGLGTLDRDGPVLITEGVADAIRAHEYGYACLSPVTTQFKHEHRAVLADILDDGDREVYVVQDAEMPNVEHNEDVDGWEALGIEQHGEGLKGGLRTAGHLRDQGVDAYLAELPQIDDKKVDLDDYLEAWANTLAPVLASAGPAAEHEAYETATGGRGGGSSLDDGEGGGEHDGDDLTREEVEDALDHVSSTLSYDEWIQLGYAVHDWNDGAVGQRVFEDWSRKSPKWSEPESPNAIEWIWENATAGGRTSVATLVYRAMENGWKPPRRDTGSEEVDDTDPTDLDVTLDAELAWEAAGTVTPDQLDTPVGLDTNDDAAAWECPRCGADVDVVRAAAIDAGIVPECSTPLRDDDYDRAYEHARRGLGAPLPEYVSRETATERWDLIQGAIDQLDFWYLDEDALNSTVTGRGDDVDGEAVLTLNPAWRDSESGESVLVFDSGIVYDAHPDHEGVIDTLRLVGLDAGLIDWGEFTDGAYQLTGDAFADVYDTARDYGAPLPQWEGTDAYNTAVLPDVDEVLDDDVGNDTRLQGAYDDVADLYTEAASSREASVMNVLPGLGKTGQVFRNATDKPALYTAGRKELMADGVERAEEHGATPYILPVFAENGLPETVQDAGEAAVREHGQRLLRDRWNLVERVEDGLPDDEDLRNPDEYKGSPDSDDEVHLDRESCPTADGEYGLDWWLAVHVARARGYRPQQIHENARTLFGDDLPCTCEDGTPDGEATCPYTDAWDSATDPEEPIDVLIGHYTHAHVEGARTYAEVEDGRVQKTPRVVALDEFPGNAYQREFGEEYPDLAAWLADALREDVEDQRDLHKAADDLWSDETVREWLSRDDTSGEHGRLAAILNAARTALQAVSTAEWLLDARRDALEDLGVVDALQRIADAHPEFDAGVVTSATATISKAVHDDDNRAGHTDTLNQLKDVADDLRELQLAGNNVEDAFEDALADADHVNGALASLVTDAIHGYRNRDDGAVRRLGAACEALKGGPSGCEVLAMHSGDGYAHPLAHALLYALIAPDDAENVDTVRTSAFTFGRDEGTRLNSVRYHNNRVVIDRNNHGAIVNRPPAFTAAGSDNPVVGLDATGRKELWELVLGREVRTRDIHDTDRERREFLRDVYGLQVIQTSPHANSYEGDPSGKNFDDDVELVRKVADEYGDAVGEDPAVLTTKTVEETLEDRLDGHVSATDHYGDLKGSNALASHRLGVLLGCQHFGDHVVERWAALAGEEATRTGYGMDLDYTSSIGNAALGHMREDQVMQAALRFGRDSDGAIVFTHTAALRDDLPVVADGEVVRTFSRQAQAIADAAAELASRPGFTAGDVAERVVGFDPSARTVRRTLSELAEFGYLEKTETPNGFANEFELTEEPDAAVVDVPDIDSRAATDDPGQDPLVVYYTWSVRVAPGDPRPADHRTVTRAQLPAPGDGGDPGLGASAPN